MEHSFNVEIAKIVGVNAATIFRHIEYWIAHNRANNANFYDGDYWTFNSKKAFVELFPYLTERQVDYAVKNLIDKGLLKTGNYNKSPYDRTLWYAITKAGYSILQNCEMKETNLSNENNEFVEPIPDNYTNNYTDDNIGESKGNDIALKEFLDRYPSVQVDIYSTGQLSLIDFAELTKRFDESEYLRLNCNSLQWIVRNRNAIMSGKYKDREAAPNQQPHKPVVDGSLYKII